MVRLKLLTRRALAPRQGIGRPTGSALGAGACAFWLEGGRWARDRRRRRLLSGASDMAAGYVVVLFQLHWPPAMYWRRFAPSSAPAK